MFNSLIFSTYTTIVFLSVGIPVIVGQEWKCENNTGNASWKCLEAKKCRLANKIPAQNKISCGVQKICCPEAPNKTGTSRPLTQKDADDAKRMALSKCHQYTSYRYNNYTRPGDFDDPPINVSELDCFDCCVLIPGPNVPDKEYPFLVLLGFDDNVEDKRNWHCGGALISERFILSAAHCTKRSGNAFVKWALLGKLSRSEISSELKNKNLFKIVARINHPMYKPGHASNDIALFKLETPIRLSPSIRPVCLTDEDESKTKNFQSRAKAAGWNSPLISDDEDQDYAKKISIHILDDKLCIDKFKNDTSLRVDFNNNTMICGGSLPYEFDSKNLIDVGSPMVVPTERCMHLQVGILSHRSWEDDANGPEIYTRISYFLPWIQSVVWPVAKIHKV